MNKCIKTPLFTALALLAVVSCKRDPINQLSHNYQLNIHTNLDVPYRTVPKPEIMDVVLYDLNTGKIVNEYYMEPEGGIMSGAEAGTYGLLVYNFGTSTTIVDDKERNHTVNATGSYISRAGIPAIREPEHLFVARDTITLPYVSYQEELYEVDCYPKSICDVWLVIVEGVKKLENAHGISFSMTGQSKGNIFFKEDPIQSEVSVNFPGIVSDDMQLIYGPFNTFGRLDDRRIPSVVDLFITGPNNAEYHYAEDVTDQFFDPDNTEHIIRIRFDKEIKPREEGGFDPRVDPWDPDTVTIPVS